MRGMNVILNLVNNLIQKYGLDSVGSLKMSGLGFLGYPLDYILREA